MPVLNSSDYRPLWWLRNAHLQTVFPTLFRRVRDVHYQRERIDTPNDDFLDLDWSRAGSKRLAIISHGLEGDSHRPYMTGMVRACHRAGWDALAWNFRSCSGEINRQLRFYHSGATDDLHTVLQHVLQKDEYDTIVLIGFSMGGNLTLMYLGQQGARLDHHIRTAAVFSVPCDLADSSACLERAANRLYMRRFLRHLRRKVQAKMALYPDRINDRDYQRIKNFRDYDNRYTAPLHGFRDAEDYWQRCSSRHFITGITIPTLIVNALDDSFLKGRCYPYEEVEKNSQVFLETPAHGGHVGFVRLNRDGLYWSERRALQFISEKAF